MPELPEVETTKTSLKPLLNKKVAKVKVFQPKLRWLVPEDIESLQGYILDKVERRAKYLILSFQHTTVSPQQAVSTPLEVKPKTKALIIHLGMSGSLQQFPIGTEKRKHDHLIIQFANDSGAESELPLQLHYHDPRRFGAIVWLDQYGEKLLNHLGAEPLEGEFSGEYLYDNIHRLTENKARKELNKPLLKPINRPIKAVIMDQTFVVGVGNIYATESLFMSNIHPSHPAHTLSKSQLSELAKHIQSILQRAIEQGGSTLKDFTVASGTTGYFQQTLLVYGRHKLPCPTCDTPIEKTTITGRASTFCPNCQPLTKLKIKKEAT